MKKLIAVLILTSLVCSSALMAGTSMWSDSFHFDGNAITDKPIVLKNTDRLAYSSAMGEGDPLALVIRVEDTLDPENIWADIYADYSETPVEGTVTWDYTDEEFDYFPTDDTYLLKEIISTENDEGDEETKVFTRLVTILPEPAGLFLLGLTAALFLRKRVKGLLAVFVLIALSALSVKAESSVTEVKCIQMWPFDRSVIINFKVESDYAAGLKVKFYGSTDNGETSFDLTEKGTIKKDGADGTIAGPGKYKAIWMPNESFEGTVTDDMKVKVEIAENTPPSEDLYMVVDLSSGAISYLDAVPAGGWSDEYKTTKMVLRKIPAGKFIMGSPTNEFCREEEEVQHEVTLTKDFYIGVFEMTQKQYAIVTGDDPSCYKGDLRPVEQLSYDAIRGKTKGYNWPASSEVDEDSFFGKFRAKTGKAFDLPTEAQWEYACRAGTTTALNNGTNITNEFYDGNMFKLGRNYYNMKDGKGGYEYTTVVGCYLPNAWGLYDMHGNALEYCLDWYSEDMAADPVTDPKGPETGFKRILRGGSYYFNPKESRSAYRSRCSRTDNYNNDSGIRVVLVL